MTNSLPTIKDLGGESYFITRYPDPTDRTWSAFNPSIAVDPDGNYLMTIRSSNYFIHPVSGVVSMMTGSEINSRLWIASVSADLKLSNLREVAFDHGKLEVRRGVEDARLFWREDGWHFTAVMMERGHTPFARLCLYRLDVETGEATLLQKHEGPHPRRAEKNWMAPDIATDHFDYVYGPEETYKSEKLSSIQNPPTEASGLRGGSCLLLQPDGTYVAVVHRVEIATVRSYDATTFGYADRADRKYTHFFARYDAVGKLIGLSREFIFDRPGIEYAAGAVQIGEDLVISFGKMDLGSFFARIPFSEVEDLIQPLA